MVYLVFVILGVLLCLVFTNKPIQIHIIHTDNTPKDRMSADERRVLEEEMNKEDPAEDDKLKDIHAIIQDVSDIMGGSDR